MTNEDILSGKAADGNWTSVAAELEKRFPRSRGDGGGFQARLAEANSLAAQATIFGLTLPLPMKEAVLQALEAIFELFGDTSDVIQFDQSCLTDNPA